MTTILLPRLDRIAVDKVLDKLRASKEIHVVISSMDDFPDGVHFAASGGSPIPHRDLLSIRDGLLRVAEKNGYPQQAGKKEKAGFDNELAAYLSDLPQLVSPDAHRDDVWSFLTTVLAPDIAAWRFSISADERYHGGVRNAFQRLWLRAKALDLGEGDSDRWSLVRELTEDALVQITERPSIGSDARLAQAIASGWIRAKSRHIRIKMEDAMRNAIITIRLRNQIQLLAVISNDDLEKIVDAAFDRANIFLAEET